MATWTCYGKVVGTKYLGTVDAETEKEATSKAYKELGDETAISLCHNCSSECEDANVDEIIVELKE